MTSLDTARTGPSRIRSAKISETIARALLDHILDGGLTPGDSLPNEREMISWLGVSRGSLREALRLLEAHGVITVKSGPGGGPVVRAADPETFAGSTTLMMQFMKVPFSEVLDARIAFEPQVAESAAQNRDAGQLAELRAAVERQTAAVDDRSLLAPAYDAFHRVLAEATNNRVLELAGVTFRKVWDPIHSKVRYTRESLIRTAVAQRHLYVAVENSDPIGVREASRQHLLEYRGFLLEHQPALLRRQVEWATRG